MVQSFREDSTVFRRLMQHYGNYLSMTYFMILEVVPEDITDQLNKKYLGNVYLTFNELDILPKQIRDRLFKVVLQTQEGRRCVE